MTVPNPAGIRAGDRLPYSPSIPEPIINVSKVRILLKSAELGLPVFP